MAEVQAEFKPKEEHLLKAYEQAKENIRKGELPKGELSKGEYVERGLSWGCEHQWQQ